MSAGLDPVRHLAGGTPSAVLVPARVARFLDRTIGPKRAELRGADPELDAVLAALHIAGLQYLEHRASAATSVDGSEGLPSLAEPTGSTRGAGAGPFLDAVAVAERLGCGPRNVRDLARRGRLRGDCISGRWLFTPDAVDGYLADRTRT